MSTFVDMVIRLGLIALAVCCGLFLMCVILWTSILLNFPH